MTDEKRLTTKTLLSVMEKSDYTLADNLSGEEHDVTNVDKNPKPCAALTTTRVSCSSRQRCQRQDLAGSGNPRDQISCCRDNHDEINMCVP
jgi:hypothetical protein